MTTLLSFLAWMFLAMGVPPCDGPGAKGPGFDNAMCAPIPVPNNPDNDEDEDDDIFISPEADFSGDTLEISNGV